MGLLERRKQLELQMVVLPLRSREIEAICGRAVPYDVDWDSLVHDADALTYVDNTACHRLNMALRMICTDDLGRDAVRQGLQRVRLRNVAQPGQRRIAFQDGVLELDNAFAHGALGMHSDVEIRDTLLAAL